MACICRTIESPCSFSIEAISHLQLPEGVSYAVQCVHLCHFFGRALTRLELRQQNPGLYLAGALANAKFGDHGFLKTVAQIVRIAQVLFATVEEAGELVNSCDRLYASLSFPRWIALPYMRNRLAHPEWRSQEGRAPSILFLPGPVAIVAAVIMLVVLRIGDIVTHLWRLNLCLFDLYDSIWMDPHSQSEMIDDLFLNLHDMADQFLSRERRLARSVAFHRQWVDELLKMAHVNWSAGQLVTTLDGFANQIEGAAGVYAPPIRAMTEMAKSSSAVASALATGYSSRMRGQEMNTSQVEKKS